MRDTIRGFLAALFMFVIPFIGIIIPLTIALGYFIDSTIISALIATTIFFIFNRSALVIFLIFIASIVVPIIFGDYDLMLISIVAVALYMLSPRILMMITKDPED